MDYRHRFPKSAQKKGSIFESILPFNKVTLLFHFHRVVPQDDLIRQAGGTADKELFVQPVQTSVVDFKHRVRAEIVKIWVDKLSVLIAPPAGEIFRDTDNIIIRLRKLIIGRKDKITPDQEETFSLWNPL